MRWKDALTDFLHYVKLERGLSENSVENYRFDVIKLIRFLSKHENSINPIEIKSTTIQSFVYESSKTLKAPSQSRMISGLRLFFDYLILEGLRKDNPLDLIESPKLGSNLPATLSVEEVDTLIDTFDNEKPLDLRNMAIIEVLYSCGLRVSELVKLRLSNLFFEEELIKVFGKGNKERFVPIASSARKYVLKYLEHRTTPNKGFEDFLFLNNRGTYLTRAMVFTLVRSAAIKAGITKKISPHSLRHSFATHLVENGADISTVQQMMGHASITTTERYLHMSKKHLKESLEKYHPRS
jgi:integrase/recombinase XerD